MAFPRAPRTFSNSQFAIRNSPFLSPVPCPLSPVHGENPMLTMKGKTVFITGASAGIGRACAETFAASGAQLVLAARRKSKLQELDAQLSSRHDTRCLLLELDVRRRKEVEAAIAGLPEEWAAVDVLVNNAGLGRGLDKLHEGNPDDWEEMLDTNVKGLLYVTRALTPGMVARGRGHVINIGSIAGRELYPGGNVYCASKFAVINPPYEWPPTAMRLGSATPRRTISSTAACALAVNCATYVSLAS